VELGGTSVTDRTDRALEALPRGCRVVTTSMTARLLLANQLRRLQGIDWSVVSGDRFDEPPAGVSVDVVPIRREFSISDVRSFLSLWRLFRRRRFAFVQTHTPKASFLGLPAARLSRTTAVYTVHGALYFRDNGRVANLLGWLFEKWCCSWAHHVLVQSREDFEVLPRVHICRSRKLRFVGNGVVIERFTDAAAACSGDRDGALPVVLMVSRLVREKGCRDFVELARELDGRARFVHVGPSETDQSDAIGEEELRAASAFVSFVGAVADVRPYLAAADIVVQPSYREGIPRVAMEAAAMGRPVVAYDVRGVREVIDPDSGLLVRRGDRDALAGVVGALLAQPGQRLALGDACRRRVVERFSEEAVLERLRALYAEVVAAS
jgi:glycosyltransferase involved in cell wall biosynthesis